MKRLALIALSAFLLGSCATQAGGPTYEAAAHSQLIQANYDATDRLLAGLRAPIDPNAPILTAVLVNIDQLDESSRFGRIVAEHIASRLTQKGYAVVEAKLRGSLFVKQSEGEILLSRELKDISQSHNAQVVVVGTYAVAADYLYVNLKVVSPQDNIVLAAHNYALPINDNTEALLGRHKRP